MIDNDAIQMALIAKANSTPGINTFLPSGTILEYNWQGTDASYPMARVQLETQVDVGEDCPAVVEWSWYIFSEQGSSKQANQIANSFVQSFKGLSFSANNVKFTRCKILENIPAIRQDSRTWRAQVRCRSIVHTAT
jgi:hypothetical protein